MIAFASRFFLFASSVLLTIPTSALASVTLAAEAAQSLSAVSYTMKDGLPSNQINVIYQDSRGSIWVGTNNGLSRYDGAVFANFSVVQGLTNNWITDIQESRTDSGTMWIGTIAGGVCKLSNGTFIPITHPGAVDILHEDRGGNLWFLLNDTLFRRGSEKTEVIAKARPSARGEICELSDGQIVVALDRSVSFYTPGGRIVQSLELPLASGDQIYSMTVGLDGSLWVTTNGRCVLQLRDKVVVRQRCFDDVYPFYAREDANGTLWVRTSTGLLEFRHGQDEHAPPKVYAINDALPEMWAGPIAFDREENMWVGTWSKGLLKVADRRLLRIDVRALSDGMSDANGHVWFASGGGIAEMSRDEHGKWSLHRHSLAELPSIPVADEFNRLWCSDVAGTVTFRGFESIPTPEGWSRLKPFRRVPLPSKGVWTSLVDRENRLWVSLAEEEIRVIDLRSMKIIQYDDQIRSLPHERVGAFYQDREGNIWIGFWSKGLAVLPAPGRGQARLFTTADGLPYNGIRSMCQDHEGRLWIGTRHGGLAVFNNGKFQSITMNDGLESNAIWQIAEDTQNHLWLRTDAGLECIDRTTLRIIPVMPELRSERLRSFGIHRDLYLWALSGDALWVFEQSNPGEHIVPPLVYVKSFTVNGSPRKLMDEHFSFEENNCVIEFVSPSFRDERSVRFSYRMLGVDTTWSAPTQQRTVTYASLRPGSYRFEVRASTPEGGESTRAGILLFVIRPPFWETWWFLAAVCLAFLSVGPVIYLRRVSNLKRAQEAQRTFSHQLITSQEQERRRISAELHDSIGQSLLLVKNISAAPPRGKIDDTNNRLSEISSIASEALDQVREISYGLRPYQLDSIGLSRTLRSLVNRVSRSTSLRLTASIDEIDGLFPRESEIGIFRILQESLNNIVKHADATNAKISVVKDENTLRMWVEDDGRGFVQHDQDKVKRMKEGFGLKGIAERVQMLGGTVAFESVPGKGTIVKVKIPFNVP